MTKVLMIGLDGATWELIKPWAKEGKLPTFKMLMDEGVHSELRSTVPPFTIPAWNSMATGKNPGKLGVFSFLSRVNGSYTFKPYFFLGKKERDIWDILSDAGKKVMLLNIPNIHYAYRINGYMIAGWLFGSECARTRTLIYPSELKNRVDKIANGYEFDIAKIDFWKLTDKEFAESVHRIMRKRFAVIKFFLKEEWDFLFAVFTATDRIGHRCWQNEKIKLGCYQRIDVILKKLLQMIDEDVILILVSDHGFGAAERIFNVNEWLIKEGYLKLRSRRTPPLFKIGLFLRQTGLSSLVRFLAKLLPSKSAEIIRTESKPIAIKKADVNWKKTKAFTYANTGGISINLKGRDVDGTVGLEEYEKFREEIIDKLKNLRDPKTGKKVPVTVYKREEIYKGEKLDKAPDLTIQVDSNIHSVSSRIGSNKILDKGRKGGGSHRINGIFLAFGQGIKKGTEIKDAEIYDIAPTILHVLNLPIPKDVDGRVLMKIFEEEGEFAKRKVEYVEPIEPEIERIRERIKKLRKARKI